LWIRAFFASHDPDTRLYVVATALMLTSVPWHLLHVCDVLNSSTGRRGYGVTVRCPILFEKGCMV
jgi:hypothetical protein